MKRFLFGATLLISLFIIKTTSLHSQIIKDDFRVNDDTIGGYFGNPTVAINENGNSIVVWKDSRWGATVTYGQAYGANGLPTGGNFRVSSEPPIHDHYDPTIIYYKSDSFLVVWRYGFGYGQWLSSDGSRLGSTFTLPRLILSQKAVVTPSGNIVLTWYYSGDDGYEIYIQSYSPEGDSLEPAILVNDNTSGDQLCPDITIDGSGRITVCWEDKRNGTNYNIYAQRFDSVLNPIGSNFLVNDSTGGFNCYYPKVAADWKGNFVITWHDFRNGNADIYAQRFDSTGALVDTNFKVNDDVTEAIQFYPDCSTDSLGNFVIVWKDERNGTYDIYAQRFDSLGNALGSNFRVDQSPNGFDQWEPAVSMSRGGEFVVAWRDEREYKSVYKRRYDSSGNPMGDEAKINDVTGISNQWFPRIDINSSGNVVVVWQDERSAWGIYGQITNENGDPIGNNFPVGISYEPDVAVSLSGSFVITGKKPLGIFFKIFNSSGDSITGAIRAGDSLGYYLQGRPGIDMDSLGNFVITWEDKRNGERHIYAQMFDSTGAALDTNFRVDDCPGSEEQYMPSVALSSSGKFLITWEDRRNGNSDIYAKVYRKTGEAVGPDFRVDPDTLGTSDQTSPEALSLKNGNFLVVWQDARSPGGIYGQLIDSLGSKVDTAFRISETIGYAPSVSTDTSGRFIAVWYQYNGSDYNIFGRAFREDGTPLSEVIRVNNLDEGENPNQYDPDVAFLGNNILFTWRDPKWEKGYDVACKVVTWDYLDVAEDLKKELKEKGLSIKSLKPNPFRKTTSLEFLVYSPGPVSLKIYTSSGRLVKTMSRDINTPGLYRFLWNGKSERGEALPMGVYFINLSQGNQIKTAKIILMK